VAAVPVPLRPSLVLACSIIASLAGPAPAAPPSFVFFLVDDLGVMDVGMSNPDTFYDTPNIDRLAATGLRFTSAYAACSVCSPTRASIMTGRAPPRTGITDYINPARGNQPENWRRRTALLPAPFATELAHAEVTTAEVLGAAGYATFFAGKWHLGGPGFFPDDQGFDANRGGLARGGPYGGGKYFSPYGNATLEDGPPGEHLPDRLARETVDFITAHREEPFFAFLSFYSVHTPLMGRPDLVAKYEARRATLPPTEPRWRPERKRRTRLVQDHAVYAAMVEAMDQAVGKVLAALEELGLADRTVVVLFSDNGGLSTSEGHPTSNEPYRAGKGWLYEGGIREPCVVRAPGVTSPGAVCDDPIVSMDFHPTILSLAGLAPPAEVTLDGRSIVPLLHDPAATLDRDALFWHYPHYGNQGGSPGGAIRAGGWKLIESYEDGTVELYDLARDPAERNDLAAAEPERAGALRARLAAWRAEVGAVMPTRRGRDEEALTTPPAPPTTSRSAGDGTRSRR
jgi:arylsulfatase A-like enzyme